ncbi:MAG: hypothetical protein AMXMBFR60_29410 [Chloroflexota bacterium]
MALPLNPKLVEKETRFAVVMYGGISLAIYIHGAAQELYHMARATARMSDGSDDYLHPDKDLTGAEKIYRLLGKALKTKFVVDILSGTSAGGLNAVFLAKALARGKKMEFVKNFWVKEGDIAVLLNDAQSLKGLSGLALQTPSPALLNSQRFYYKLLEALMRYEEKDNEDSSEPYVAELDLNITATDIRGLSLPLFITNNNKIVEPRYKNVFQFYYRPETEHAGARNDFTQECDPFLAFAARCTASIPPAFEAMQLQDIEPVLKTATFNKTYGHLTADAEAWRKFYRDYLNEGDDFAVRSFGDGGYLDNKPFSHATEALLRRRADLPVDRKLIYIEPSPVHAEDKPYPSERPDMIENISAALSLPREETIREDIEKIQQRNKIIDRVNRMLAQISFEVPIKPKPWGKNKSWASWYLMDREVLERYGQGYITYHQLLVESVVNNLSTAYARAIGWNENGGEAQDMRRWMHIWVNTNYGIRRGDKKRSQNELLYHLDLSFRMRRVYFLNNLLNQIMLNLDLLLLEKPSLSNTEEEGKTNLEALFKTSGVKPPRKTWDADSIADVVWLLQQTKGMLNDTYDYMKARALLLRKSGLIAEKDQHKDGLQDYITRLTEIKTAYENWSELSILIHQLSEDGGNAPGLDVAVNGKQKTLSQLPDMLDDVLSKKRKTSELMAVIGEISLDGKHTGKKDRILELLAAFVETNPISILEDLSKTLSAPATRKSAEGYLYETMAAARESDSAMGLRVPENEDKKIKRLREKVNKKYRDELRERLEIRYEYASRTKKQQKKLGREITRRINRCVTAHNQARKCLAYYYANFDFYDMLTFPIQYGTDAGESDIVEIIRISPEDGTRLVNEARSGRRKLAGTQLMNFGAFFKQEWRENDMLWGRLDTAEILITEMLRGADEEAVKTFEDSVIALYEKKTGDDPSARRAVVYDMMFTEILHEDLHVADRSFLYKLLNSNAEDMPASSPPAPPEDDEITLADAAMQLSRKMPGRIGKMFDPLTRLAKNIYRRDALQRIEEQVGKTLRAELGADPSPLRKQIMDALEAERRRLKRERKEVEETYKLEKNRRKDFERAESRGRKKLLGWLGRGSLRRDAGRIWAGLKKTNRLAFSRIVRAEDRERTLEYFRLGYETDPNFEPKPTIQAANRSILVLGDMLKGLSDKYPPGKKPAGFLLTAGRVLTAAVNFAIPKTMGELAFNTYWIWIAYIVAGVILWGANAIGGASASKPEDALAVSEAVRRFAFQIFAVAAAFHTLVALINGWVSRKSARIWWIYGGEIGLGIFGLILGSDMLTRLGFLLFGVTLTLHLPTRIFSISADNALGFIIKWAARGFIWLLKIAGLAFLAILFYSGMVNLGIFENAPLVDFFVGLLRGLISPAK